MNTVINVINKLLIYGKNKLISYFNYETIVIRVILCTHDEHTDINNINYYKLV